MGWRNWWRARDASRTDARRAEEEAWPSAFGVGRDTQILGGDSGLAGAAAPDGGLHPSFARVLGAFLAARAAVGVLLLATQVAGKVFVDGRPDWVLLVCMAYAVATVSAWMLPWLRRMQPTLPRLRRGQWLGTIGLDLLTFGALHLLAPRSVLNFVPLLVLPVLMAGVLTPRPAALAVTAAVSLLLLAQSWAEVLAGGEPMLLITQSGLVGSGFFVIALLAGELASRLARQELAARGSLELARQQAQLNRLVIEEMQDGVLVADRHGRVRAANPAARRLIQAEGSAQPAPFHLKFSAVWLPLFEVVQQAFAAGSWPQEGRQLVLQFGEGRARNLWVRMRFTRPQASPRPEELCVMFLQDLRDVQARLRQEKLAAMGRVSAGIAHEIRNPLAAIAQANELMAEDAVTASQRQLTQMVADNVERLKRIVDDVMDVASGQHPPAAVVDATALVSAVCREWAGTARLPAGADGPLRLDLPPEPLGVVFEPDHLRRVLVNLLDNACRHATRTPGSIELRMHAEGAELVELCVASDGPPIPPDVENHLFEPFFSTRSRGTGLGLYICKEICTRYGVSIDYRLRSSKHQARNEFFLIMRREALPAPHPSPAPAP
ncbi:sensor histidine kinase [Caldimonas tepidiphila]|uniref:sensor histidine kinase n=1 Tax=Caldimonas tepidiphila TaxID=2315841 RepID=UPI000E5C565D|nr:ATP-binding protein [Caldimonas tepidiphila]